MGHFVLGKVAEILAIDLGNCTIDLENTQVLVTIDLVSWRVL